MPCVISEEFQLLIWYLEKPFFATLLYTGMLCARAGQGSPQGNELPAKRWLMVTITRDKFPKMR